ncbi:primosomal protein N' [Alkalihalobacillus alcalophilus ATCC 27647 = CGMCC 1.3604]|uniref:Replication restart protein PriA n=1 Tax=Alkalihalobacillus alcalophilus ATCC 27647 = CGMCC 1.3604 TaxID=1218173 RepID=A0A4S4K6S6_ALKAL|nr:primosomal protein N' [Alkalihalobacillus alcalophilus]MED1563150.1 primosomal protein N' [Alkalihalobacillus alcalophilus]THG91819.1 primosomal protein N' [Alkalihalobacillus alcalophilus ATCC 27647 = CGMCC 1.3604]
MIAKIIVDVPSAQTDRMFDYKVPEQWQAFIRPGMRVIVPFGPRKVQGFIVELTEHSEFKQIKSINELQDTSPVLTAELMELGKWLAEKTLSYQISAFQVMLPAALKTKVKKEIRLKANKLELPFFVQALFTEKDRIPFEEVQSLAKKEKIEIQTLLLEGKLTEHFLLIEKAKQKKVRFVVLNKAIENIAEIKLKIPSRAKKQHEMLEFLVNHPKAIQSTELLKVLQTTRSTLQALIDKEYVVETEEEVYREAMAELMIQPTQPLMLTPKQTEVLSPIVEAMDCARSETFLLHGVTGSGKTEIYLQAIAKGLEEGKEAIMLVPEISLTPQMVERFKGRFGDLVAVLHSGLSAGEKLDEWRKIQRQEVKVVVGARSAVFAPFQNLGLIIIDEEHETSYKQEDNPRYHARDVAIYRGEHHRCPVILGSATPSLESYARAQKGIYTLLTLLERVNARALPSVEVVDMREELRNGNRSMFSSQLMEKMKERLEKKEQIVLFLNRRGHSTFVMCRDCGYVATCEHCDVSFTYHRHQHRLKCHYCGDEQAMPTTCHSCQSEHIRFFGSGTQKVEEELTKVLPEAKVIRMDVDTTSRKGSHGRLLEAFGRKEADILLGTQMIAKGLDFPSITLVGVLAADSMLHIPDFRSAERTFQLMEQVSGRAGRHELPGEVYIQTYTPEHYSIELVQSHDYERFFQMEMNNRKRAGYPPYYFMALVNISDPELTKVISVSEKIAQFLKRELHSTSIILGPVVSPLARLKDRYRYQCVIKYKNEPKLERTLREIQEHYMKETNQGSLQIQIDLNPFLFM